MNVNKQKEITSFEIEPQLFDLIELELNKRLIAGCLLLVEIYRNVESIGKELVKNYTIFIVAVCFIYDQVQTSVFHADMVTC